jgi:CheY-like chemotaxis protein
VNATLQKALVMLLVEDNPADVVFFQEALEAIRTPATVHVADHGVDALQFLRHQGRRADSPRPDVVVLDLNLPIMNGREVLNEIAADPDLMSIPMAILTTSTSEAHVCEIYPRGRCLYFTKTEDFGELQSIVLQIAAHARTA